MKPRKLVQQLDTLKAIKPRTEWRDQTRDILLAQISAQGTVRGVRTSTIGSSIAYIRGAVAFGYSKTFEQLFARPLVLTGALSVVLASALSIVVASQHSMPGDPLYAVKRTGERIHVAFVSPVDRPTVQLNFATERMVELSELSAWPLTNEEKATQAHTLAQEADANIKHAKNELLRLKKETPDQAVLAATQLKKRATQSQEQVEKVTESQPEASVRGIIVSLDETKEAALQVIVEKKDDAHISEGEVAAHLQEVLDELQARVAKLQKVRAASFSPESDKRSAQMIESLQKARDALTRKDFSIALADMSQVRTMVNAAEKEEHSLGGDAVRGNDEGGLR